MGLFFRKHFSDILITIQFSCLGLLILTGPFFAENRILLIIELFGLFLGFWAIFTVPFQQLKVKPEIKANAFLISHGPYAVIRHPMYAAILVVFTPLIIDNFSLVRLLIFIVLTGNLLIKLRYEESLLEKYFLQSYSAYKKKTWKLIPLIF